MQIILDIDIETLTPEFEVSPEKFVEWLQGYALDTNTRFEMNFNEPGDPDLEGSGPFVDFMVTRVEAELVPGNCEVRVE